MKLLVMSDSHGNVANMLQAVQRENPDRILHLGDCSVFTTAVRRFRSIRSPAIAISVPQKPQNSSCFWKTSAF